MPLILASNSASGGYNVANSLRFNQSAVADYLTRTPAGSGNRRTFTFSFWYKKTINGTSFPSLFTAGTTNYYDGILFQYNNSDTISMNLANSSGTANIYGPVFESTQVFRDPSAWYHFVVAFDTTQATASDRAKVYVNGSQITSFSVTNYPAQNFEATFFNTGSIPHYIGTGANSYVGDRLIYGYLSEFNFINGQQLTPSSFGETDTLTGIWKPKAYTGTYGTNGFYQKYTNSAALGTDSSGNGNTYTVSNITSVDQSTDTPTNNFATFNPVDVTSGNVTTFIDGNLNVRHGSGPSGAVCAERSTIAVSKGKWYWETKCIATGGDVRTGIISMSSSNYATSANPYSPNDSYNYKQTGQKGTSSGDTAYGATYTAGDIISILYDADNGSLTFYKNGVSQGVAFSGLDTSLTWGAFSTEYNGGEFSYNFGSPIYAANAYADGAGYGNFSYAVPSGYYSLNTKNLATYG